MKIDKYNNSNEEIEEMIAFIIIIQGSLDELFEIKFNPLLIHLFLISFNLLPILPNFSHNILIDKIRWLIDITT